MTGWTRTFAAVRRGVLCLGATILLTGFGASAALAADSLQVTSGGATLLNMGPGEIRTMTTDIYNPTSRDAQVSTVASVGGEIGSTTGHILLTVDACSVPWTDVTPAGTAGDRSDALVLTCAGGEEELLSGWAVMGTGYADSTFRVDSRSTTYLRTQVRLGDDAPQNMQGVHGSLSYTFASIEAPPRAPVTAEPTVTPESTATPESTVRSGVTVAPELTVAPEATVAPEPVPATVPVLEPAAESVAEPVAEPTSGPGGAVTVEAITNPSPAATVAVAAGLLAAASTLSVVLVRRRRQDRSAQPQSPNGD